MGKMVLLIKQKKLGSGIAFIRPPRTSDPCRQFLANLIKGSIPVETFRDLGDREEFDFIIAVAATTAGSRYFELVVAGAPHSSGHASAPFCAVIAASASRSRRQASAASIEIRTFEPTRMMRGPLPAAHIL
jgi:hypothetical protein